MNTEMSQNQMKKATFKEWNLSSLDQAFGLSQVLESSKLQSWQIKAKQVEINNIEKQLLIDLQAPLQWGGKSWNEVELENKFISPLIMSAKVDDRSIGYFLERPLFGIVGDYELSGIVDGMIAKGFRDPQKPFFCIHEYKRSIENQGSPDGQVLASMLLARELNQDKKVIYGLYIVGFIWNFIVLDENQYCISQDYNASTHEVFDIFQMIKALKVIIYEDLLN